MHIEHPVEELFQQTCDHVTGRNIRIPCRVQTSDRKLIETMNDCVAPTTTLEWNIYQKQDLENRSDLQTRPKEYLDTLVKVLFPRDIDLENVLNQGSIEVKPEEWEPKDDQVCFLCCNLGTVDVSERILPAMQADEEDEASETR